MPASADYLARAAELRIQARLEANPEIQGELEAIAHNYEHLAVLADKNQRAEIVYQPPEGSAGDGKLQSPEDDGPP